MTDQDEILEHPDDPSPDDLLYEAWCLIANACGGNWDDAERAAPGWKAAAELWRDRWREAIQLQEYAAEPPEPWRAETGKLHTTHQPVTPLPQKVVRPEDNDVRIRRSSMHQAVDAVKAGYGCGDIVALADRINDYVANGHTSERVVSGRTNGTFPG